MFKFLFKRLLAANYSAARWLVNKKMPERIIPSTLHFVSAPLTFIAAGIYFALIGSINYQFESYIPILIGLGIVMLGLGYIIEKKAKKMLFDFNIQEEYEMLDKSERNKRNLLAFLFFWGCFALFFYLSITYAQGYLVH
ncbi:hypothetical protein GCM10009117_25650 [Gangjinia marincola]|uniref:Uncharacterized protein n=1 Tax=Gangjinia marincola TaxID=578463 RepID=A0ABN1MKH9_9FLAO